MKSTGSRRTETTGGRGAMCIGRIRKTVMASHRGREIVAGRAGHAKAQGMNGRGEFKEWRKTEQRGQRLLGMLGARRGVYMAQVSFFLMSNCS